MGLSLDDLYNEPGPQLKEDRKLKKYDARAQFLSSERGGATPPPQKQTSLSLDTAFDEPTREGFNVAPRNEGPGAAAKAAFTMGTTMLGGLGGAAVKGALQAKRLMPFLVPGEMGGSFLGEYALQESGLAPQSNFGLGLSAVAPFASRLIPMAIQHAPRLLPGAPSAIRAGIADTAAHDIPSLIRAPDAKTLYEHLPTGQAERMTAFPATQQSIAELRYDIANNPIEAFRKAMKDNKVDELIDQLEVGIKGRPAQYSQQAPTTPTGKTFSKQTGLPQQQVETAPAKQPGFTFDEVRRSSEALGKLIGSTPDANLRGAYRKLYKSVMTDLEAMPAPAGSDIAAWKQAKEAYKKEIARADLGDAIERLGIKSVNGVEEFKADPILNWIRTNKDFRKRVSQKEYQQIQSELRSLARFTGDRSNKLLTILLGGATGGVGGAAAGYVAADVLSKALLNPTTRRMLTKFVTAGEGRAAQEQASILAAGLAGALQ